MEVCVAWQLKAMEKPGTIGTARPMLQGKTGDEDGEAMLCSELRGRSKRAARPVGPQPRHAISAGDHGKLVGTIDATSSITTAGDKHRLKMVSDMLSFNAESFSVLS